MIVAIFEEDSISARLCSGDCRPCDIDPRDTGLHRHRVDFRGLLRLGQANANLLEKRRVLSVTNHAEDMLCGNSHRDRVWRGGSRWGKKDSIGCDAIDFCTKDPPNPACFQQRLNLGEEPVFDLFFG